MNYNENGLTFSGWLRTATFGNRKSVRMDLAREAWKNNEDPTDYAIDGFVRDIIGYSSKEAK